MEKTYIAVWMSSQVVCGPLPRELTQLCSIKVPWYSHSINPWGFILWHPLQMEEEQMIGNKFVNAYCSVQLATNRLLSLFLQLSQWVPSSWIRKIYDVIIKSHIFFWTIESQCCPFNFVLIFLDLTETLHHAMGNKLGFLKTTEDYKLLCPLVVKNQYILSQIIIQIIPY